MQAKEGIATLDSQALQLGLQGLQEARRACL
jgi:hypothetical protein